MVAERDKEYDTFTCNIWKCSRITYQCLTLNSSWTCQTTLQLETVKFWGIDLLKDVEIEIASELEDLEIKGCSALFNFRKLWSKEEKLSAFISEVENLLTLGLLCTFKSSAELGKTFKSCF